MYKCETDVKYFTIYVELCEKFMLVKQREREMHIQNGNYDGDDDYADDYDDDLEDEEYSATATATEDQPQPPHKKRNKYTLKDIRYVCLNLYQQELAKACGLMDTPNDECSIGDALDELWDAIFTVQGMSEKFKMLILRYQEHFFKDLPKTDGNKYKVYFGVCFDFNIFHLMHRCLQELFAQNGHITDELLEELSMELNILAENNK